MRINRFLALSGLAVSLSFGLLGTRAFSDPDAVMPFTASELPIMATTPNLVLGTYGPIVNLDAKGFNEIPAPIYLEKTLEEALKSGPTSVSGVQYHYPESMKIHEREKEQDPVKAVTAEDVNTLAQKGLEACHKKGFLCDAQVSFKQVSLKEASLNAEQSLYIEITPLIVKSIDVEAPTTLQTHALKHLMRSIPIGESLKLNAAEKQLRLIQSNPDLPIESSLTIEPFNHEVNLKIVCNEKKRPLHVIGSFNNLDQIIFGRYFAAATAISNNATGHGDSLMVSGVRGKKSLGLFAHYEFPLKPDLKVFADYQMAHIKPVDADYSGFGTNGDAYRGTLGLKYIVLNRPDKQLSADVAVDFKQSETYSGPDLVEREGVRSLRGGINYDQSWEHTTFSTRHEVAQAFSILGGSKSTDDFLSWFRGGSQFFRYTGYATLNQDLPLSSTGTLNFQWQYTPDGLSNFDVGGLGGTFYGRGYREVYLFVDSYAITTAQWQFPAFFIPKSLKIPFTDINLRDSTKLLTFVDYGYGNISHPSTGLDGTDHILSTGFGARTQLSDRVSARIDVGYPLLRMVPFKQEPRIHFGVDAKLF